MTQTSQNVQDLFGGAQDAGDIGADAAQVLAISDLGQQMQAGLGIDIDDVSASEVVLVTVLVDDSGSISGAGNEQAVRDGVNTIIQSLGQSKQADGVLASIRYLNGIVLQPYGALEDVPELDTSNYNACGGTPLYDQSIVVCGQAIAKTQEFLDGGVACRGITVIITDGADMHSRQSAADVQKVVKDMILTESHIVVCMGIDDGRTNFRDVFGEMGIDDRWILTPGNDQSEIRKACQVVSQTAVRASQGAGAFSQVAGQGFTS